jgi:hypothetical protein
MRPLAVPPGAAYPSIPINREANLMKGRTGSELTDADLTDAERAAVARITRTIEIATTIAATPDQVMPLARLLTLATTAAEIESINADMERTIGKIRHGPSAR